MKSKAIWIAALGVSMGSASYGAFAPNTLSIVRVGDGSIEFSQAGPAQSVFIDTYDAQSGALLGSVPLLGAVLPSTHDGADGHLSFTGNGQYLTLGAYSAAAGSSDPVTAAVPRAVVRVDGAGNVATASLSGIYTAKAIVAVASQDGNSFFLAGENSANGTGGLRYLPSLASTTTYNVSHIIGTTAGDSYRNLRIVNGSLYGNTPAKESFVNRGVYRLDLNASLPITADVASTAVPIIIDTEGSTTDPYGNTSPDSNTGKIHPKTDSALIDLNGDGSFDLAYSAGGKEDLEKWVRSGSNWIRTETIYAPNATVIGRNNEIDAIDYAITPGGVDLYLSNDYGIWKFTDSGGLGGFASPLFTGTVDPVFGRRVLSTDYFISAGTNEQFRGLAVYVPEPSVVAIVVPAVVGLIGRRRRRNECV